MFEVSIQGTFSAAHRVKGYRGDCAGVHGHTYRIEVRAMVRKLDKLGIAIDFRKIKMALGEILTGLDHKNLNDLDFFKKNNATAEWVAVYIFRRLKKKISGLRSVKIWEGLENSVTYYE